MSELHDHAIEDSSSTDIFTAPAPDGLQSLDFVRIDEAGYETLIGQIIRLVDREIASGSADVPVSASEAVPEKLTLPMAEVLILGKLGSDERTLSSRRPSSDATIQRIDANSARALTFADELLSRARLRKVFEVCAGAAVKTCGFAKVILDDSAIAEQLKTTPHFGALSQMFGARPIGSRFSRHNYVSLHAALLFDAKMSWPGVGLSSATSIRCGKGPALSGLEVCQSWAVLLSWGHLFGTFASERALFFLIEQEPELESDILKEIGGFDKVLAQRCQEILRGRHLLRLFYVLASWRACRQLDGARRRTAIDLLSLFLSEANDPQTSRLKWIFRTTRLIAYNMIHGCVHGGVGIQDPFLKGIAELVPMSGLLLDEYGAEGEDNPLLRLMADYDSYHAESTFASSEAASLVLGHVRSFKRWWQSKKDVDSATKLSALFTTPEDWKPVPPGKLTQFARFRLIGKQEEWLSEVRAWLRSSSEPNVWGDSNFIISPSPRRSGLICDIYCGQLGLGTNTIAHVVSRLAGQSSKSWSASKPGELERGLWRSCALFVAKIFDACLKPGYRVQLDPASASDGHLGYLLLAADFESGRERCKSFIRALKDPERARELNALVELRESAGFDDVPWAMFLARTRIVDEVGEKVADIDGLWAEFRASQIRWYVMETKVLNQPGAAAQLADKVISCIALPTTPVLEGKTTGQKVAYASFVMTDRAPLIVPSHRVSHKAPI